MLSFATFSFQMYENEIMKLRYEKGNEVLARISFQEFFLMFPYFQQMFDRGCRQHLTLWCSMYGLPRAVPDASTVPGLYVPAIFCSNNKNSNTNSKKCK